MENSIKTEHNSGVIQCCYDDCDYNDKP